MNITADVPPLPGEEWRPVPDFPDYEVSSHGRVLSRRAHPTLLTPGTNGTAYYRVQLMPPGQTRRAKRAFYIHRLVAAAFLGPCPDGHLVRHLNGDHHDNRLENLAYGTPADNARDRQLHGTDHHARKTHCKRSHPFDEENTYISPSSGGRTCRVCLRENIREKRKQWRIQGLPAGDPRHGTRHGYDGFGCRCEPCRSVSNARQRDLYAARSANAS